MPDIIKGVKPPPEIYLVMPIEFRAAFFGYVFCTDGDISDSKFFWSKCYVGNVMHSDIMKYLPISNYEGMSEEDYSDFQAESYGLANICGLGIINIGFNDLIRYGSQSSRFN